MRVLKALGGVLIFMGCLVALTGILATVAPMIDNEQMRRIIESFGTRTLDPMVNWINAAILLGLRNNYLLFGIGAGLLVTGGLTRAAALKAAEGDALPSPEPRAERAGRPSQTAPQAQRQASPPVREAAARREQSLSPYAAAAYGKALSGKTPSDIAAKYMPRSIIDMPAESAPAPEAARPAASASVDWKQGETIYCRVCGAGNPWQASFCDQCGNRLSLPEAVRADGNRLRQDDSAYSHPAGDAQHTAQTYATPAQAGVAVPPPEQPPLAAEPARVAPYATAAVAVVRPTENTPPYPSHGADTAAAYAPLIADPAVHWQASPSAAAPQAVPSAEFATPFTAHPSLHSAIPPAPVAAAAMPARPRIVSTVKHVITAPSPLGGDASAAAPAPQRPRIVSTIGKRPKDTDLP